MDADPLLAAAGPKAKKKLSKATGSTAKYTFKTGETDPESVVALMTQGAGALVSVHVTEQWTVKPTKRGVKVKPTGQTRDLSDVDETSKGIASAYGYQLLFSVPAAGEEKPITLLGYSQGLISAKEL